MSLDSLMGKTATVIRPARKLDSVNNDIADWAHATSATTRARLEPTASTEVTIGRDTVVSDWLLYLPSNVAIDPYDRVVIDGRTFEVVGVPADADTPRGVDHREVRLRYVEG